MRSVFLMRVDISSGGSLSMAPPSTTFAPLADPNEIATYSLPRRPSVSMVAIESCLMMLCVDLLRSIHTVILSVGLLGNSTLRTDPLCTPPTRTSAPESKPTTLPNCAFSRYVDVNIYCLPPMMKIPDTRIASATIIKAPSRAALDIIYSLRIPLEEFQNKIILTFSKLLETAFHHHVPLIQQRHPVSDGPCTTKIVRDDYG